MDTGYRVTLEYCDIYKQSKIGEDFLHTFFSSIRVVHAERICGRELKKLAPNHPMKYVHTFK